jgi:hypothetical protein
MVHRRAVSFNNAEMIPAQGGSDPTEQNCILTADDSSGAKWN